MTTLSIKYYTFVQFLGLWRLPSKQWNIRVISLLECYGGDLADVHNIASKLYIHSDNRKIHIHLLGKCCDQYIYVKVELCSH
jgi:hypothetical protein